MLVRDSELWSWHPGVGRASVCSCHGPTLRAPGSFLLPPIVHKHTPAFLMPVLRPKLHTGLLIVKHWPVVVFVGGGLVVASSVPFPASAAAPSQECWGSSSGLQHTNHITGAFWRFGKQVCWGQNMSEMSYMRYNMSKTLRSFLFSLPKVWEWTIENQNIFKKKKLVNSGDTNLTVCYLDAGRPMWCSYLCDRCSTPLHLLSQPAPSLQVVDLNSSESTQWEGKWWMECMESTN